jgi:hypothetical protein
VTVAELIIEDLTIEKQNLEIELIRAIADAATFRQMLQVTLTELEATSRECGALRRRLRQAMGAESWGVDTVDG